MPRVNSPHVLTGCISKLSVVQPGTHAYFDALKDYAAHYAEAQAYLVNDEVQITHDYTLIDSLALMDGLASEPDHGVWDDDGEPAITAQISDEDIDSCGYMAWLRH